MRRKKRPNGKDEDGRLWIDGRCRGHFVTGDTWPDMTTPTPGPWTAAAIKSALDDKMTYKAFCHLCNMIADHNLASFATCTIPLTGDESQPLTDEQRHTLSLIEQTFFETCASLADFLNLLSAGGKST